MQRMRRAVAIAVLVLSAAVAAFGQTKATDHWVATWTTAVVGRAPAVPPVAPPAAPPAQGTSPALPPVTPNNQTLRQIVRSTIGGSRARVVFSNAFGTAALNVGAASIGLRDKDSAVLPSSFRTLTVNGNRGFRIPAGAIVVSDTVDLVVPASADLAVDLFVPDDLGSGTSPITMHNGANQTNYVSPPGNHTGEAAWPSGTMTRSWFLISRVEVAAAPQAGAVATFGDSITDGTRSTADTNNRWPDHLSRRLAAQKGAVPFAVMNLGIAGNQLLSEANPLAGINALARFERDVLGEPGVTHVIVLEGINDIGLARQNPKPDADDLIAAHKQLIARAHGRGLRIYGATLTPFEGAAYFTQEGETKRQAVNRWIRTSGMYDGVIDFDAITRDPAAPSRLLPAYDSGDHLHPGDAGYKAMGEAIDLTLFKRPGT
jgi:lysophospholipase L1-like esterase